jgi:DtxR family Mn-dependent transcriptional regulator
MEHLLSEETNKKFFEFMKRIACNCEKREENHGHFDFKTTLDLCNFKNPEEFSMRQMGDKYLPTH